MPKLRADRRNESRPDSPDRRQFPRPPLWLNLIILGFAVAVLAFGQFHRSRVQDQYSDVLNRRLQTPDDVNRIKEELAAMDLSREQLSNALEGRMQYIDSLETDKFYLSVDTAQKKLRFHYRDTILREADVEIGAERTIEASDEEAKSWTFVPVKGAFELEGKVAGHSWEIPEWVYLMKGEAPPEELPTMRGGLGRYVLQLPSGYVIHSPPSDESPLEGPKPGSIMVAEEDLRAIWPRIHKGTQIYIF